MEATEMCVGSMRAIGIRKRSTGVTFVQSENEKIKIVVTIDSMTSKVRPYLQWHQPTFLESLDTAEEKATECRSRGRLSVLRQDTIKIVTDIFHSPSNSYSANDILGVHCNSTHAIVRTEYSGRQTPTPMYCT
jgi:hypothetical protein